MSNTHATARRTDDAVLPDWYLHSRLKTCQILLLIALDEHRNIHKAAAEVAMTQLAATRSLGPWSAFSA